MSRPASPPPVPPAADDPALAAARPMLAALPEAALVARDRWDGGGVEIVFANERFAALTGFTTAELAGRSTRELHGPRTDLLAPRSANRRGGLAGECWLHRKDGSSFYATWRFAPLAPGLLVGVYRDATDVRRLQEAMLHSQKLDTVGQLAGGAAHDFNNLLSIVNGYCEILGRKLAAAPADTQRDLQEIRRAGHKAAAIARQILEFSRRQETEARAVNPNTLIREIGDILRRSVGEAVKLELRLSSDLGNTRIDPTQFQQVLLNLCFNARDAMPAGGKLTLRTFNRIVPDSTPGLSPGPHVGIEVADTGTGMDEATLARMFEPFFTTKAHGTGFGLPMVRVVINEAGGAISVRSQPGTGTTFEILLPETAEPEQVFSPATPAQPRSGGSEEVWVIEPDDVIRKMIGGILAVDGYRVSEFSSTAAAQRPRRAAPQLLILDCAMANAARVTRALAKANPRLRVLSVSVEPPAATLAELTPRFFAHLPKPFALSTLLRAVRKLLDVR